jgi:hypothetical protein
MVSSPDDAGSVNSRRSRQRYRHGDPSQFPHGLPPKSVVLPEEITTERGDGGKRQSGSDKLAAKKKPRATAGLKLIERRYEKSPTG